MYNRQMRTMIVVFLTIAIFALIILFITNARADEFEGDRFQQLSEQNEDAFVIRVYADKKTGGELIVVYTFKGLSTTYVSK